MGTTENIEQKLPRGPYVSPTEDEIAAMTSPEALMNAIPGASTMWRESAPVPYDAILDAKPISEKPE